MVWCDGIKLAITKLRLETQSHFLPMGAGGSEGLLVLWARQELLVGLEAQLWKAGGTPSGIFLHYNQTYVRPRSLQSKTCPQQSPTSQWRGSRSSTFAFQTTASLGIISRESCHPLEALSFFLS